MSAQSELDALFAVYEGYLDEYADRVVSNGPFHGLHKFLLGTSTPGDRKADSAFYRAAEQAASALAAAGPEPGEAARAVRYMILEADGADAPSRLMIEAAQALAIPLLAYVTAEDRFAIAADYQARYPKKRMLTPRQRELANELNK